MTSLKRERPYFFFEDFFADFFAAFFFGMEITSSWPLIADSETHSHALCQRSPSALPVGTGDAISARGPPAGG
jgi:hypothetical protein